MTVLTLHQCEGLDTRQNWDEKDRFALASCNNIQLLPGGAITSRPALILDGPLSSSSVGLYDRGGYLRALVPSGQSLQATAPTGVIYDPIGKGGTFNYSGLIGRLYVADTFGVSPIYGPHGYVNFLNLSNNLIEHHWIQEPPASGATYTNTLVALPFTPGKAMIKVTQKVAASNPSLGQFNYCSTLSGPADWVTAGDAGEERALQFVNGAREMIALAIHRSRLAVFYEDAVQLWQMDTDPANIELLQVINGPGTRFQGSVVNIGGDVYALGPSGFFNLYTATVTGEDRYADIGDKIKTLTDLIAADANITAVWSQRRSQWLIANGTTIFCWSYYPLSKESGWTTWTMPVAVDYMTELNGTVYIRSGDNYYHLDDTIGRDSSVATDIAWSWQTRQFGFGRAIAQIKALRSIIPQCSATCTYTPVVDGRTLTAAVTTIPGGDTPTRAYLIGSGRRIAIAAAGTGLMRTNGLQIEAEVCGV